MLLFSFSQGTRDPMTSHLEATDDETGMEEWELSVEETGAFEATEEIRSSVDPGWKDELNLAEFPIAALTDRVPDGQTRSSSRTSSSAATALRSCAD